VAAGVARRVLVSPRPPKGSTRQEGNCCWVVALPAAGRRGAIAQKGDTGKEQEGTSHLPPGTPGRSGRGRGILAGAVQRAAARTSTRCLARRPVPCAICWRQEMPGATISVSGPAAWMAGKRRRAPMAWEIS